MEASTFEGLLRNLFAPHLQMPPDHGIAFVALPERTRLHDLEAFALIPRRVRRNIAIASQASFIEYVTTHRIDLQTNVYIEDQKRYCMTAIIDDHAFELRAWNNHRATFESTFSDEYRAWRTLVDMKQITQLQLAEFLEDRRQDIVTPAGSAVLALVSNFKATKNAVFSSAKNLATGDTQFEYATETKGVGGVTVPETLSLALPMFRDQTRPSNIQVRLKFSLNSGALAFRVELPNRSLIERTHYLELVVEPIKAALPDVSFFQIASMDGLVQE